MPASLAQRWIPTPRKAHRYLIEDASGRLPRVIEDLMLQHRRDRILRPSSK
jgi:hypothetical protein